MLQLLLSFIRFKDLSSSSSSDSDEEADGSKVLKPVVCLGWQPDSDVFVLGEMLQFTSTGEMIPPHMQEYVFIPFILEKLGLYNSISPVNVLPDVPNALYTVMEGIHHVAGANCTCAIFCLGKFNTANIIIRQNLFTHKIIV